MAKFSYIASTTKGVAVKGALEAPSKGDVAKLLSKQGLFLVSCAMQDAAAIAVARPSPSAGPTAMTRGGQAQPSFHAWWESLGHKREEGFPTLNPKGKVTLKEL